MTGHFVDVSMLRQHHMHIGPIVITALRPVVERCILVEHEDGERGLFVRPAWAPQ